MNGKLPPNKKNVFPIRYGGGLCIPQGFQWYGNLHDQQYWCNELHGYIAFWSPQEMFRSTWRGTERETLFSTHRRNSQFQNRTVVLPLLKIFFWSYDHRRTHPPGPSSIFSRTKMKILQFPCFSVFTSRLQIIELALTSWRFLVSVCLWHEKIWTEQMPCLRSLLFPSALLKRLLQFTDYVLQIQSHHLQRLVFRKYLKDTVSSL